MHQGGNSAVTSASPLPAFFSKGGLRWSEHSRATIPWTDLGAGLWGPPDWRFEGSIGSCAPGSGRVGARMPSRTDPES